MREAASPTALTHEWFERVWNQADETAVYRMMAPDCLIDGLVADQPGPEGFLAFHRMFRQAFDDIHIQLLETAEQDDRVMGHARFTGRHKKTDQPVAINFSFSGWWRNGQVCETRNTVDYTGMLAQLGVMDPQTMTQALMD